MTDEAVSKSAVPQVASQAPVPHSPSTAHQAQAHGSAHATSLAGSAAVSRIAGGDIMSRYPVYRARMATTVTSSRRDLQRYLDEDYGVGAHVVNAVETVSETVSGWYDWIRRAKQSGNTSHVVAPPPIAMWDAVDQALAAADKAYDARDAALLQQREKAVSLAFMQCSQRFTDYLGHSAHGATEAISVSETAVVTGGTVVGFAVGGPGGAAVGAGLARAGIDVSEAKAAGEKLDWKTIGLESVKEAVSTLAFALIAGPIGEKVFLPMLEKSIGPALANAMGSASAESVERYLAGFLSGVGTGAFMNAVQLQVDRMHGGVKMTEAQFARAVLDSMIRGGIQQLAIDGITHGAGHIASGAHGSAHEGAAPHEHATAHEGAEHHAPAHPGEDPAQATLEGPKTVQGWSTTELPDMLGGEKGGAGPTHDAEEAPAHVAKKVPHLHDDDPNAARLNAMQDRLAAAYPKGYVVKPLDAAASGGVPTSSQSFAAILKGEEGPANHKEWMEQILEKPDTFMVQELIDIKRSRALLSKPSGQHGSIKMFGQVKDEYRVHVVGGKVVPNATYHRWSMSRNMNPISPERTMVEQQVQAMLDRLPTEFKDGTPMALDAAVDTSGNVHVIETNPGGQSGFLAPGYEGGVPTTAPHAVYKFLTGRDSKAMATAKGVGAGLAGTALTGNPIAGAAIGLGVYNRARTIELSADPQVAEMQRAARGRLTWVQAMDVNVKPSTGTKAFVQRHLLASDELIEEPNGSWGNFSWKVNESMSKTGTLDKSFENTRARRRVDGAVFVGGEATQALRYKGTLNVTGDFENIRSQEDKITESDTWNQYNPGAVGRAELLSKYLEPAGKSGRKAPPVSKARAKAAIVWQARAKAAALRAAEGAPEPGSRYIDMRGKAPLPEAAPDRLFVKADITPPASALPATSSSATPSTGATPRPQQGDDKKHDSAAPPTHPLVAAAHSTMRHRSVAHAAAEAALRRAYPLDAVPLESASIDSLIPLEALPALDASGVPSDSTPSLPSPDEIDSMPTPPDGLMLDGRREVEEA